MKVGHMNIIRYIGIDPGSSCGWAVLDEDGKRVASGTWDLKPKRHQGAGMRYVRCARMLRELLEAYPLAMLGYEEVARHAGTTAAHVYGGIVAVVQGMCEELGVPYAGVPVGTIKKHATGSGRASKSEMEGAALKRWDRHCRDDNEADALWVAATLREGDI